jgi:hypothetical protein
VIGSELQLEAVNGCAPFGNRHDAGVVDEHVDVLLVGEPPGGEAAHRGEVGDIELVEDDVGVGDSRADLRQRALSPLHAPAGSDDVGALACHRQRRLEAEATVGARHENRFSSLIGKVVLRPSGHDVPRIPSRGTSQATRGERRRPPQVQMWSCRLARVHPP